MSNNGASERQKQRRKLPGMTTRKVGKSRSSPSVLNHRNNEMRCRLAAATSTVSAVSGLKQVSVLRTVGLCGGTVPKPVARVIRQQRQQRQHKRGKRGGSGASGCFDDRDKTFT